MLTLLGAVAAGAWAVESYIDTKEKEFYTEYWNRKMDLFQKVSVAASTMATTSSHHEFNDARSDYWRLYFGELSLVEGVCVKQAMIVFARCVPKEDIRNSEQLSFRHLRQPSYRLATRLKDELAKAWKTPFSELELSVLPKSCAFPAETECSAN